MELPINIAASYCVSDRVVLVRVCGHHQQYGIVYVLIFRHVDLIAGRKLGPIVVHVFNIHDYRARAVGAFRLVQRLICKKMIKSTILFHFLQIKNGSCPLS